MACHKADKEIPGNGLNLLQKVGKIHIQPQVLAVGVHILAQKGDVLIPLLHQRPDLGQHVLWQSGPLPAPDVGDDAVSTKVVAAVHNGHPGLHPILTGEGDALGDGPGLVGGLKDPSPAGDHPVEQLGEFPQRMGAEHKIHMAVGLAELLGHPRFLSHAAAKADDLPRMGPLGMDQRPHVAKHPVLGVLSNGAGVDNDDVGGLLVVGKAAAHCRQIAPDMLRIGFVLLPAIGVHIGQRLAGPGGPGLLYFVAELPLPVDVGGGDAGGFSFQGDPSFPGKRKNLSGRTARRHT